LAAKFKLDSAQLGRGAAVALRGLLIAAVLMLAPAAFVTRSALYRGEIPLLLRVSGLFLEWFATAALLLLPLGLLYRRPSSRARVAIASVSTIAIVTWLGFSWGLFFGSGQFLDAEALAFASGNGLQLTKHFLEFNPGVTLGLPVAIGLLTTFVVRAGLRSYPEHAWKRNVGSLAVLLVLGVSTFIGRALTLHFTSRVVSNTLTGDVGLVASKWRTYLRREIGPLTHLANQELQDVTGSGEDWPNPPFPLPEYNRKQRSIQDYIASVSPQAKRYNVLIILIESMRADTLTSLGGTRVVMPNLEQLAADSLLLTRGYAQATHSNYADPTVPSSQHPLRSPRFQQYPTDIPYPHVLLWDLLQPLGYSSAIISSQNEKWGGMLNFLQTPALTHLFHAETFHDNYAPADEGFAKWSEQFKRSGKIDDVDTVNELIRFTRETPKPFVTYTVLENSHFPYRFPEPGTFQPSDVGFNYTFANFPRDKIPIAKNRYHNALHYMDEQLGRLFTALRDENLWDDTILVIAGDTGQAFFEHDFAGHGRTPYEELIHIPIVVHAPGLKPQVSSRVSQGADIAPTVLSLLGLPPHPAFQGASALPGEVPERPIFTVVQVPAQREIAVTEGSLKLIADGDTKRELYDLSSDPGERRNLWGLDRKRDTHLLNLILSFRRTQLGYYATPSRWSSEYVPSLFP
jgi:glucan phosphoethanolaminetransferase (alkaline phosphatase superfamily)